MKTLLRIDASIRTEDSCTRELTDHFQARWLSAHPDATVVRRDLARDPIPHFSGATLAGFYSDGNTTEARALSDSLIEELWRADHVLIGSRLYNLTVPSTLKAYFDHAIRIGATFEARDGKYQGLLKGKGATVITARGGLASTEYDDDFQTPYLKAILAFIGIEPVVSVRMEGTAFGDAAKEKALAHARQHIDRLFDHAASNA